MPTQLAREFREELGDLQAILLRLNPGLADVPWRAGGWTRKQIVGHLLDSATNNRQRFVRAGTDGRYAGPRYAQEAWVAAHEILAAVVDRIAEERLETECAVGEDAPVTLRFLVEDYLAHQRWHLGQMTGGAGAG